MFGINERCRVNQFIAKKNFLSFGELTKAEKDELSDSVKKITLTYQIQPANINIKPYKDDIREYPLINVIEITVDMKADVKRLSGMVMATIPYPCVVVFESEGKMQLAVAHQRTNLNDSTKNVLEDIILTGWVDFNESLFDINALNLTNFYTLYSDIVDAISIFNAKKVSATENLTGEQARDLTASIEKIDSELAILRVKLKKETQFNRKMELNIEIKKLEKQKKEIVG
jgi:hypothetical protein